MYKCIENSSYFRNLSLMGFGFRRKFCGACTDDYMYGYKNIDIKNILFDSQAAVQFRLRSIGRCSKMAFDLILAAYLSAYSFFLISSFVMFYVNSYKLKKQKNILCEINAY